MPKSINSHSSISMRLAIALLACACGAACASGPAREAAPSNSRPMDPSDPRSPSSQTATFTTQGRYLGIDNNGIDIRPATPVKVPFATIEYPNYGGSSTSDPFETSEYTIANNWNAHQLEVRYRLANGTTASVEIPTGSQATFTYMVSKVNFLTKGLYLSVTPPGGAAGQRQRVHARNGYDADIGKIAPATRTRRRSSKLEVVVNVHGFETVLEFVFSNAQVAH